MSDPMIGRGFHTLLSSGEVHYQGEVVGVIESLGGPFYLVQLFEWISGGASTQHVYTLADFAARDVNGRHVFRFFDSVSKANEYWAAHR